MKKVLIISHTPREFAIAANELLTLVWKEHLAADVLCTSATEAPYAIDAGEDLTSIGVATVVAHNAYLVEQHLSTEECLDAFTLIADTDASFWSGFKYSRSVVDFRAGDYNTSVDIKGIINPDEYECMMLDVCLLSGDRDSLISGTQQPVFSMALYKTLSSLLDTRMYTTDVAPEALISAWTNIYKAYYDSKSVPTILAPCRCEEARE